MTDQTWVIDKTYAALRLLSELSENAKSVGDDSLMYAANRAWHELYNHQTKAARKAVS